MSGSDKDSGSSFLARWSRRKQDVRDEREPEGLELSDRVIDPTDAGASAGGPDQSEAALTPEELQALPAIDDIHAESDITGFLRTGVPEALKQAALRRMWSVDPLIRDHVGPAEYAWDFNNPGSMAGFATHAGRVNVAGLFSGSSEGGRGAAGQLAGSRADRAAENPAVRPAGPVAAQGLDQTAPAPARESQASETSGGEEGGERGPSSGRAVSDRNPQEPGAENPGNQRGSDASRPSPRHGRATPR